MSYNERVHLIEQIEQQNESRVIILVTGDRPIAPTVIADDSLRPLYDHLLRIRQEESGKAKRIDLILYSRGGHAETPWKFVTKVRQFCNEFCVVIPYKAHSAATMIALGADRILVSPMSELGPIDPMIHVDANSPGQSKFLMPDLGVEDVAAYLTFLRDRAHLTDQAALADSIKALADHLTPTLLGRMERVYSHIRLVARKLLSLRQPPLDESTINSITEVLTEKMYAHGHGISHDEAKAIGLPVDMMDVNLESLTWQLLEDYEAELNLLATADASSYFPDDATNRYEENNAVGVCMESRTLAHVFGGTLRVERVRQLPPQLNLNVNLNLQLPANINPQSIPAQTQQLLQQLMQQASQQVQQMVQVEVAKQAPVQGIKTGWVGGVWKRRN